MYMHMHAHLHEEIDAVGAEGGAECFDGLDGPRAREECPRGLTHAKHTQPELAYAAGERGGWYG